MTDAVGHMMTQIFDYFFAQNAPMTIMITLILVGVFVYFRYWATLVLRPLRISEAKSELIKRQMDMAEAPLDRLRGKLYGLYRHERRLALEAQGMSVTEARDHLDADMHTWMHSLQLRGVHGSLRAEIRKFFRDNHLATRNEEDFRKYLAQRTQDIWAVMVEAMNMYWFSGMTNPSRSDLYDAHEKNQAMVFEIISEILIEGRKLAIEYQAELSTEKKPLWGIV